MNLYLQNLRLNNSDIVLTLLLLHLWFTISIRTVLYAFAFLEKKMFLVMYLMITQTNHFSCYHNKNSRIHTLIYVSITILLRNRFCTSFDKGSTTYVYKLIVNLIDGKISDKTWRNVPFRNVEETLFMSINKEINDWDLF